MEHEGTARSALRGLLPTVLTIALIVGGVAGGRAGSGAWALLVAVGAATATLLVLGGLAVALLAPGTPRDDAPPDLDARWAAVEPVWSGRR